MIKKILLGVGITIVAAGVTFGTLYFIESAKHTATTNNTSSNSKKLVLDHSKDYGACTLLDTSSIKTALKDAAANLQAPLDAGITSDRYFGDGVKDVTSDSQTCVYAFTPGGSTDEALSAANGLIIKQTVYTNKGGPSALITQTKQNPTATIIPALGDAAFYITNIATTGPEATSSFTLLVFEGNKSTSYAIIQPAKSTTFTADSAKTALLALVKLPSV
jgi:hypothetical protein